MGGSWRCDFSTTGLADLLYYSVLLISTNYSGYSSGTIPHRADATASKLPSSAASTDPLSELMIEGDSDGDVDDFIYDEHGRVGGVANITEGVQQDPKIAYYAQFMPTRAGFSSSNLASAVIDPSAEPFSAGRTLPEVAAAARANITAKYEAMTAGGRSFDVNSWEGVDWYSAIGDMDRRALYAVSSNQGGLFTKEEQRLLPLRPWASSRASRWGCMPGLRD